MTWYNPRTWFSAAPAKDSENIEGRIYVAANPDHPHVGLSVFSDTKLEGPSFCVHGISLASARLDLCGKVIDWSKMTSQQAESIKVGGRVTLPIASLKSLFK